MTTKTSYIFVIYLIAFSAVTNAKKDDDWTLGDILKYGAMTVAGGAAAVFAAPIALGAAGFASTGIVGGSIAAGLQAGVGNVVGGSIFAGLQSAGVAGLGGAASAAVATTGAAVGAGFARVTDKRKDD